MKSLLVVVFSLLIPSGLAQSKPELLDELARQAEAGDVEAMFNYGSLALIGGEYPKAFKWLNKASEKSHGPSIAFLGYMYFNGFSCKKDLAKARQLYEKSAELGAHQGFNNLAHLYRYGIAGVEKDRRIQAASATGGGAKKMSLGV